MSVDIRAAEATAAPEGASRSGLRVVTVLALLGAALCFAVLMVLAAFDIALIVITTILLASAALAATRMRWAPVLAGLVALSVCVGGTFFQPFSAYHLTHPNDYTTFALTVLPIALGLIAGVAGIAAGRRRYAGGRTAPAWLAPFVTGMAGLAAGALIAGALAGPTIAAAGSSTASEIALETLVFAPDATTIAPGSSLNLVDVPDGVPHVIANGEWVDGRAAPSSVPGAPQVPDVQVPDEGSITVGPFREEGTFPLFCEIHPGMQMTVTVGG